MEIVETPLISLTDDIRPGVHIVLNTLQTPSPDLQIERDQDPWLVESTLLTKYRRNSLSSSKGQ